MERGRPLAVGPILLLGLAACGFVPAGGGKVALHDESFPWVDPSALRTWAWSSQAQSLAWIGDEQQAGLIDWRIRGAVERGMAARGYAAAPRDAADLIVRYRLSVAEASTGSVQEYLSYRAEGGTQDMGEALMGYERGTLLLEIYERATRRLAWRGSASAVVQPDATGERAATAVADLLARFPAARRLP